jgi:hypothetical protein
VTKTARSTRTKEKLNAGPQTISRQRLYSSPVYQSNPVGPIISVYDSKIDDLSGRTTSMHPNSPNFR